MKDIDVIHSCPSNCTCLLREFTSIEDLVHLERNRTTVNFFQGETIFKQGALISHIGYIIEGYVKTYLEGDKEKKQILYMSGKDDFIGQLSLFYGSSSIVGISAVTDCKICLINESTIKFLINRNPAIANALIQNINKHNNIILTRLSNLNQRQMHGRVALTLLYLSELLHNSNVIDLPLSRKELAELAGMTTESFIRILAEYKSEGIVSLSGKKIEIVSRQLLKKLTEVG